MTRKSSVRKLRTNSEDAVSDIIQSRTISDKEELLQSIKLELKHKNETQKQLTQSIKLNDVTVCIGPAGTGKSICSIAIALKLLKSMTQLKDETLPSLPGDAMDKMHYQNMSFFDSLIQLVGEKQTGELVNNNLIKFDVIGSFRGRNLSGCIIILDETQNISHDNLKTILTRISDNTKIILLGDPNQIDIKTKKESSLSTIVRKIKDTPIEGVEVIEFTEKDIVRHRLTGYFISLFNEENKDKNEHKHSLNSQKIETTTIFKKIKTFFKKLALL